MSRPAVTITRNQSKASLFQLGRELSSGMRKSQSFMEKLKTQCVDRMMVIETANERLPAFVSFHHGIPSGVI
jgi:hypothetical protein